MRRLLLLFSTLPLLLMVPLALALGPQGPPLGVRGEWEWLRLARQPMPIDVLLASVAVVLYVGFAALGMRFLSRHASLRAETLAVSGLLLASVAVQAAVPAGAPEGYGLARWGLVLHIPASTGYYTVARSQMTDARRFLADYPEWIRRQDALHIGTHPPGLFLIEYGLLRTFQKEPGWTRTVLDLLPASVLTGFRAIEVFDRLPMADRAALGVTGALTLLVCAGTVVPLYLLARASLAPAAAWSAAALWPLVPAAILFQPLPDTAYPFLAAAALALAAHAHGPHAFRGTGLFLAAAAGLVLAAGMALSLVFLAVGLVVGLVLASAPGASWQRRASALVATGAGFLLPTLLFWVATGANPFVVWWWNQRNHARFYQEYHRTYGLWLLVNPIELAVALGVAAAIWAGTGLASGRSAPRAAVATLAVLVLLTVSGRNLSEVARLWLPFLPGLLTAAGHGLRRLNAGPKSLALAVATQGAETLLLQAMIQVVYPI